METQAASTINVHIDTGINRMTALAIGKERNWFLVIILSLCTAGIYAFVYLHNVFEEAKRFAAVKNPALPVTSGGAAVGFMFVPLFGQIWALMLLFKYPGLVTKLNEATGRNSSGWAYLGLLNLIPLLGGITVLIVVQTKMNEIWRAERALLTNRFAGASPEQLPASAVALATDASRDVRTAGPFDVRVVGGAVVATLALAVGGITAGRAHISGGSPTASASSNTPRELRAATDIDVATAAVLNSGARGGVEQHAPRPGTAAPDAPTTNATSTFDYVARLSDADHCNTRGARLTSAQFIVQQDRANYHQFGKPDSEDRRDDYFARKEVRLGLAGLAQESPTVRHHAQTILTRTPLVGVKLNKTASGIGGIEVTLLDTGSPVGPCPR